jgi:Short C-terminal domain/Phospholipase_D-nuclease N-terminal
MSLSDVLVEIFWFMILVTWIWLLIAILGDIFRDHELSGLGKGGWTLLLVVVPWLGAVAYLIVRGGSMNERTAAQAQRNEQAFQQYVQQTAAVGAPSTADELTKLAALRDGGTITTEEYERAKAKVLGAETVPSTPQQRDNRTTAPTT